MMTPVMKLDKLSPAERLILANQYKILEALHPRKMSSREADHYAAMREIVEAGDASRYSELVVDMKELTGATSQVIVDKSSVVSARKDERTRA
jgi:uncharacterized protein YfbU (UPF0304 family)